MFNREISVRTMFSTIFMAAGALIFLTGVFSLFDYKVFSVLGLIAATLGLFVVLIPFIFKNEKSDEMAIANFRKAQAKTLTLTMIVIASLSFMLSLTDMFDIRLEVEIGEMFSLLLGMIMFSTGFLFGKYERGDA